MWWQSLSAGPSFSPMYFIMTSLRSSIRALPSISCRERSTLSAEGHITSTSSQINSIKMTKVTWMWKFQSDFPGAWRLRESLFYQATARYSTMSENQCGRKLVVCWPLNGTKKTEFNTHMFPEQLNVRAKSLGISLLDKPYNIINWPGRSIIPWTLLVLFHVVRACCWASCCRVWGWEKEKTNQTNTFN